MATRLSDSFQILFLDREEPRRPQFSSSAVRTTTPDSSFDPSTRPTVARPFRQPRTQTVINRSPSNASSHSSAASHASSDVISSRLNSVSTRASSISIPNWQAPPTFVQHMAAQSYIWGFDLPCEFFFLGCHLRFDPGQVEAWISHSASHFVNAPFPSTTVCTFCDEVTFRSDGHAAMNWRDRMLHIFDHLAALTPSEYMRPDFWIIEHMEKYGLISSEDHAQAVQVTERPHCDHMYPLDWKPQEMLDREERASQRPYDVRNEKRQRKRELMKGKSTHQSSSSHRLPKSHREVVVRAA